MKEPSANSSSILYVALPLIALCGCAPLLEPSHLEIYGPGESMGAQPSPLRAFKSSPYEASSELQSMAMAAPQLPACCTPVTSISTCGGSQPWLAGSEATEPPPSPYRSVLAGLALKPSPYEDAPRMAGMIEVHFTGCCAGVVMFPTTCASPP